MKIHTFKFENKSLELKIKQIYFSDLTLLVGVSGVGKTLILQSILDLKKIAMGKSLNGVEWEIEFSTGKDKRYFWKGAFEKVESGELLEGFSYEDEKEAELITSSKPKITYEELRLNNTLLVERKGNEIKIREQTTPRLSSYKSIVNLFNEEEDIAPAFEGFNKIIESSDIERLFPLVESFDKFSKRYTTIDSIQNAQIPTYLKLALAYKNDSHTFNRIKERFINIFEQIQDIKFEPLMDETLPFFLRDTPHLKIKEKNVSNWIHHDKISSGMLKTLMQIGQLFLSSEGTVVLIDEFENSLGLNCIDIVTETLLYDNRNLQYILTSHHPYIINAIGLEHWKIVIRKGGEISVRDATEYRLGTSRHEAYKQLIQLSDYKHGIIVE